MTELAERYALVFTLLSVFSLLTIFLLLGLGTRVLARLPEDYFINPARRQQKTYLQSLPRWSWPLVPLLKNILGLLLAALGVMLLFLPGQGLLTLLAGVMLLDFPGKYRCELWLLQRGQLRRALNWLRQRAGAPPLQFEHDI